MLVFPNLQVARREGFRWVEHLPEERLHKVERDVLRQDGRRVKMLAFAQAEED